MKCGRNIKECSQFYGCVNARWAHIQTSYKCPLHRCISHLTKHETCSAHLRSLAGSTDSFDCPNNTQCCNVHKNLFSLCRDMSCARESHWPQSQTARSDKMKIIKNSFPISLIYEALRSFCIMCTATLSHIKARAYTTRGRYSIQHTFIYCVRSDKSVLWRRKSIDLEARTSERKTHQVSICMLMQCIPIDDESRIDVINVMQP